MTSAFHMPRSVRAVSQGRICRRALSGRLADRRARRYLSFSNVAVDGLARTDIAVREWIGLIAYRATGKIERFAAGAGG